MQLAAARLGGMTANSARMGPSNANGGPKKAVPLFEKPPDLSGGVITRKIRRKRSLASQVQALQEQLLAEREARNADIRRLNDVVSHERAAHAHTKLRLRKYVEDMEGVREESIGPRDQAIGWVLGALVTLDEYVDTPFESFARRNGEIQQGLRAIGRSLEAYAPRRLPKVALGNLIETAKMREWAEDERSARAAIAALSAGERAALAAVAQASDLSSRLLSDADLEEITSETNGRVDASV